MVFTCGRDVNDLALHRFHKGRIFSLWVYNNHISVRVCENDIRHFLFRRKGLACTRHAEDKGIAVQQVAAVGDNHIFADYILSVIHAVFVIDFLHTERDKHRKELMTPDEVRMLDNRYALLFIRGERPVMDFKYDILKHPNVKLTTDGGQPPYIHGEPTQAVATLVFDNALMKNAVSVKPVKTSYELLSEEDLEEQLKI